MELPEEILHKIFKQLDVKSLRNARSSCKRWNDVISNSVHLMQRFILYSNFAPSGINECNKNEIINIQINQLSERLMRAAYKNVILIASPRNPLPSEKFNQFACENLINIEKLHLENLPTISIVPTLRSCASTLTHLTLKISRNVDEKQKIDLTNLIFLKLQDIRDFLKLINAPKLETLQLDCVNCDDEIFLKFLKTCEKLKNLAFDTNVPSIEFKDIPFKLESLQLPSVRKSVFYNFYRDFMKSQKDSLKRFRMCNTSRLLNEVADCKIFFDFAADELSLTSLDLTGLYDNENEFDDTLRKNHTIKELKLNMFNWDYIFEGNKPYLEVETISRILRKCVSVESLTLEGKIYGSNDLFVECNLEKLKYLHIEEQKGIFVNFNIQSDNLETLSIKKIEDEYDFYELLNLITKFPRVKIIEIRILNYNHKDLEDQIEHLFQIGKFIEEISIECGYFSMNVFANGFEKYKSGAFRKLSVGIEKRENAIRLKEKFKGVDSFEANIYWICDSKEEKMMAAAWNDEQIAVNIKQFDQCFKIESIRGNQNKVDDDEVDPGDMEAKKLLCILLILLILICFLVFLIFYFQEKHWVQ